MTPLLVVPGRIDQHGNTIQILIPAAVQTPEAAIGRLLELHISLCAHTATRNVKHAVAPVQMIASHVILQARIRTMSQVITTEAGAQNALRTGIVGQARFVRATLA